MNDLRATWKALIIVLLIVLLMPVASSVSAAQGGQPGKPTDSPGGGSTQIPPGQAKKATSTPEATDPTDQPDSSPSPSSASPAGDEPDSSTQGYGEGAGADIIAEFSCRINLAALGGGDIFTTISRSVSTPSGNTVLKCTGVIPPELVPSKTVIDEGFLCVTFLGVTINSRKVFTPSGVALLTCIINGKELN